HPRIFCLHTEIIDVSARIPQYICEELRSKRNVIVKTPASYGPFASVQTILIDHTRNKVLGGSDPRTGGTVIST
ncbi:MAG: gamma-glutamyltransferase, partial [Candidatus Bathyarchaeota archaeon]